MGVLQPSLALQLSSHIAENWRGFRQRLVEYLIATRAQEKNDKIKFLILCVVVEEALAAYNPFTFKEGHSMQLSIILSQSEDIQKKTKILERHIFICKQTTGESMDQYVTELKRLRTVFLET